MASAIFRVFSRNMATSGSDKIFKHVTVIGGGLMGSGIAQVGVLIAQTIISIIFHTIKQIIRKIP